MQNPVFPAAASRVAAGLCLALSLFAAAPLAAKDASKSAAAAKDERPEEARWPLPAATGQVLEYDQANERVRVRAQGRSRLLSSSVLEIRPGPSRDAGYEQHWSSRDGRIEAEGAQAADQRALVESANALFAGQVLRVRLDADGAAVGVEDVAEVYAPRFRQLLEDALAKAGADAAQAKPMLDGLARPEVVQGLLMQLPAAFYFPGAGGVPFGDGIEYQDQSPNPFGGEPFPMLGRIQVAPGAREGEIDMTWTLAIDPVKGAPILWEAVGTLIGKEQLDSVRDELPDQIHFETVTRYRIDAATGVVRWMESVETRRILQNEDVSRTTLALREARPAAASP